MFWRALGKTVIWVVAGVGFQFLFGFILALLLNKKFRGRGVVRAVSLIPWVTPGVLIGLMWRWMYDGNFGVINDQMCIRDRQWIKPGKVQVFNVIEEELTSLITRTLKPGTIVVLVFDTDTGKKNTLLKNIRFLQKDSNVKQVLCIMPVSYTHLDVYKRQVIQRI